MSNELGFVLVGCGRIARKHAELIGGGHIQGAKLAGVCDVQEDRARSFSEKYVVPYYTDMHEMLQKQNDEIDVVKIKRDRPSSSFNNFQPGTQPRFFLRSCFDPQKTALRGSQRL